VDLLLALAPLLLVRSRAGELLAAALLLFGDSLFGSGRSLGKRIAGLRVVMPATRRPAGIKESLKRNAIFVAGLVPAELGFPLLTSAAALFVLALLEAGVALRPMTRDLGRRRLGDLLAGTQVIDASLALGLPAPAASDTPRAAAPLASRAARKDETACASR
jgi:uncharacterized RDD family membrane protein YckC